ncbi:MAG: methylenetetrahydrofolate--tRNA-(uracil(54)-C(5))-methyltransferase (FADH(2)-oxidizing) TrmFO [Anaerolineae bacterium]|nr:methylenetetrahydrofolate--tRNA-(uracil(54)-C(5))-methyltransferase (FADH(2)-oxidizing) TrmFO [Anaerolineae bacterium]MDW8071087.1 methylenetetrahydrofolate--tRNA-(uracil(54)-C(5))-methyltransferase (FADH(2)-oxidizing) TrmFO [Anaerolineae bacterium]
MRHELVVIGGGLAGCEAAWQAARCGIRVTLIEMRPLRRTPAHVTDRLAELVCSNSLGARAIDRALGLLKEEMRRMDSLIIAQAEHTALPAGGALAVDRERFAEAVTACITTHPHIEVQRAEATSIPDVPVIVASGPLTTETLAQALVQLSGEENLYFFDAMAPIVAADSINMKIAFRASRYGRGEQEEGDYINCPMTEAEYDRFLEALLSAERIPLRDFEQSDARFFEACLPVEVLAARGRDALRYGPMRPVGLVDPRTGQQPFAVVQLRQDNLAASLYNMVGFQTNLRWSEQERVFRLIPGLERAEFVRFGQMHRNTFVNAPRVLDSSLRVHTLLTKRDAPVWLAGQITGSEGYVGSALTGLVAGLNAVCYLRGRPPLEFPQSTMTGALLHYLTHADPKHFQPMKANFGLLPPLERPPRRKRERYLALARRALSDLESVLQVIASLRVASG